MSCSIVTVERQLTAVIRAESPFDRIPQAQQSARAALAAALPSLGAGATGAAITRWTRPTGSVLPMEIGVIVGQRFAPRGEIVASELPAGRAVHLSMAGGFENLPRAWETLFHWLQGEKLTPA